jgi:hypothetical protein
MADEHEHKDLDIGESEAPDSEDDYTPDKPDDGDQEDQEAGGESNDELKDEDRVQMGGTGARTAVLPSVRPSEGVSISTVTILFMLLSTATFIGLNHWRKQNSRAPRPTGLPPNVIAIMEPEEGQSSDEFLLNQIDDYQAANPSDYPKLLELLAPLEQLPDEIGRNARVKASELRYERDLKALKVLADLQQQAADLFSEGQTDEAMKVFKGFPANLLTPKWEWVIKKVKASVTAGEEPAPEKPPAEASVKPSKSGEVTGVVKLKPRAADDEHFVRGLELLDSLVLDFQFQEAKKVAGYLLQSVRLRTEGATRKRLPKEYMTLLDQRTQNMQLLDKMLVRVVRAINLEKEKALLPRVKAKFRQVARYSPRKVVATRKGMMPLGRDKERVLWRDFKPREFHELASNALDLTKKADVLALSIYLLEAGVFTAAEHSFRKVEESKIDPKPYVSLLPLRVRMHREIEAEQVFRKVQEAIAAKSHQMAKSALLELRGDYKETHFVSLHHGGEITRLERRVDQLLREEEAGQLWASARSNFEVRRWVETRFNLNELKDIYSSTEVYQRSTAARPSWRSMVNECNSKLASIAVIRKDGRGDFTTIRDAITNAPRGKRIEIHDNAVHSGISMGTRQIVLAGAPGYFPTVRGLRAGPNSSFTRMRIVPGEPTANGQTAVIAAGPIRFTQCVLHGELSAVTANNGSSPVVFDNCLVMGAQEVAVRGAGRGAGAMLAARSSVFYECGAVVQAPSPNSFLQNSIVSRTGVVARGGNLRIRFVCLNTLGVTSNANGGNPVPFETWRQQAGRNSDSFSSPPRFRAPTNGDFRLHGGSPCKRKGSDAKDLGVRWDQEIWDNVLEMSNQVRGLLPRI